MSVSLYLLYCQHCAFKKITDGSDLANFKEVKTCRDCGGARQFKCPGCGYLLRATKAATATVTDGKKHLEKMRAIAAENKKQLKTEMKQWLKEKQQLDESDE